MASLTSRERARLRRLALSSQGLLRAAPFGRGSRGAAAAIQHLGYLQIDSISVVERAHHHVLHSRVPGFAPGITDQLLEERRIFEYWAHAAAFLPMSDFRFSLPYKQAIKQGKTHWLKSPDKRLMKKLLDRIRIDGPLRSRDLEARRAKSTGWWDWKPEKEALEQLFMQGHLMVSDRTGFQKTYDLAERVLPGNIDTQTPSIGEYARYLLDQQLRSHGCATLRSVTYLRRNAALRAAVNALIQESLAAGELEQVDLATGEALYIRAGALAEPAPRVSPRLLILSPFDNAVIQRERLKALFDFDYQLECYVPAAKRRHGYFALPLLYRDMFVGRMDCKAHRKRGQLEIRSLHWESHPFDVEAVAEAFARALDSFIAFQGCDSIAISPDLPRSQHGLLRSVLRDQL